MKGKEKINKHVCTGSGRKINATRFAALLLSAFLFAFIFAGCSLFGATIESVRFKSDAIYLNVGDRITINEKYLSFTPINAKDKSVTLSSGNKSVFTVRDNQVTAVAKGEATLKVKTNVSSRTASCKIIVSEVEPESVAIVADGELYQTVPDYSYVKLYADFGGVISIHKNVNWTLKKDDVIIQTQQVEAASAFGFFPDEPGKYGITASIENTDGEIFTDSAAVYVYEPFISEPQLVYEGELNQAENDYSTVNFSLEFEDSDGNLDRVIEWILDGTTVFEGAEYDFTPAEAGEYRVSAYVCGKLCGSATVKAFGAISVQNARIDFDNYYPDLLFQWDTPNYGGDGLDFSVVVSTSMGDDITELNSVDDAYYFNGNSVMLGDFIGPDAEHNIFNTSFILKVRPLGGDGFSGSNAFANAALNKISTDAKAYLENKYFFDNGSFSKNYFISDNGEFSEIIGYFFMWREKPILGNNAKESISKKIYAGYYISGVGEAMDIVSQIYDDLHITGQISYSCTMSKNVITLSIDFMTDSLPSLVTKGVHSTYRGGIELAAARPHIDYDTTNTRTSLPIENSNKLSVFVSTSEQLYYVTVQNFRPAPISGSQALNYYNYAKNVLLEIINDGMTDVEKAHAIYDWIMWKVNYDYVLLSNSSLTLAESVKYNAYYLDGVFSDSRPYAVCDGIAKAYALMCNMENIECIRVAGVAGNDYDIGSWGGHAWNKVKLNGEWYIVDATWGDELLAFAAEGISGRAYESATHKYFLLTDKQVEKNRREDGANYPRTALTPYNWYDDDIDFNGTVIDFYINADEVIAGQEAARLAQYIKHMVSSQPQYTASYSSMIPGYVATLQKNSKYAFFDIKVSKNLDNFITESRSRNVLISKLTSLNLQVDFITTEYLDDYIISVFIKL